MPLAHDTARNIGYQIQIALNGHSTANIDGLIYDDLFPVPEPQEFVGHWVVDFTVIYNGDPANAETDITTRLAATSGVTDLVPERSIYVGDVDGDRPTFPYVSWGKVSNLNVEHTMTLPNTHAVRAQYRFDVFAETR